MDEFVCRLSPKQLKASNYLWNQSGLNRPFSVGYTAFLIQQYQFATKEEWRRFYYETGAQRLQLAEQQRLNLCKKSPQVEKLQHFYGRTEEELTEKGRLLFRLLQQTGTYQVLTEAECIYAVKYRVIGETWNGNVRELRVVEELQRRYPNLHFQKTDFDTDLHEGVDFHVYHQGRHIAGLQIKPSSYLGTAPYLQEAHQLNQQKNSAYSQKHQVPVLYVFQHDSKITNPDLFEKMRIGV